MPPLRELIDGVGRQMEIDFQRISKQVPHMGERGRSREDVVTQFLRNYLPRRIGVSRGIIVDHAGSVSAECDVVLYDADSTPVFRVSESVRLFPAETVLSVIQVKSFLSKEELRSAAANIRSVSRLERAKNPADPMLAGFNLRLFTGEEGILTYNPKPLSGAIFAFDSPEMEVVADNLVAECGGLVRSEWPTSVVSLTKGTIFYSVGIAPKSDDPREGELARDKIIVASHEEHHPLVMFYLFVLHKAERTLCASPDLFAHLGIDTYPGKMIDVDPRPRI